MKLRIAQIDDAERLTAVINAAFRKAESFLVDRDRVDPETVRGFLEQGEFLVAEDGDDLIGCLYLEKKGERAYLGLLSVDPLRQRAGVGSLLMRGAEEHCANSGCQFIDIRIVSVRRELPGFYQRRGYIESGNETFPAEIETKVPCHFVKMSKKLG